MEASNPFDEILLQEKFIEKIEESLQEDQKLVDFVAQSLGISNSGAYKKISGGSKLNLSEIIKLCSGVNISFDEFTSGLKEVRTSYAFHSEALKHQLSSFEEYWINICNHLKNVVHLPNVVGIYLTNEIPFFYYLDFPNLFHFKNFVWNQSRWKIPGTTKIFSKSDFQNNKNLEKAAYELSDIYTSYNSLEIWNTDMLRITYMQLKYFIRSGCFSTKHDIYDILSDIDKMLIHIKNVCESGYKLRFGDPAKKHEIKVYLNELSIATECIYIKSDIFRIVYNKYDAPNYIRTDNKYVCDAVEIWIEDIIHQSTLISGTGERDRNYLFKTMFDEFDLVKEKIEGLIKSHY